MLVAQCNTLSHILKLKFQNNSSLADEVDGLTSVNSGYQACTVTVTALLEAHMISYLVQFV